MTQGLTKEKMIRLIEECKGQLADEFKAIEQISFHNQQKVQSAFERCGVGARHFIPSQGYGYNDESRSKLDEVFAEAFGAEDALVRPHFASGTHAIACSVLSLVEPGKNLVSITGKPYDTLEQTFGLRDHKQSIRSLGMQYHQVELMADGDVDIEKALETMDHNTKVVYIQRSRGYAWRTSLSISKMREAIDKIKAQHPEIVVVVDNCYGEFVEEIEPCTVGADLVAGSLIKNAGGGLCPTGGYCAGKKTYVEGAADRLFAPGLGKEIGSYDASYRPFFQGLYMAPHTVAQARMGALLFAKVFDKLGYDTLPKGGDSGDLVCSIRLGDEPSLLCFCKAIQASSPVDAQATPLPWDMPGYEHPVIMAAGTFVQGASIELSADAPCTPPYTVYVQGGLTLNHSTLALQACLMALSQEGLLRSELG